MAKFKLTPVQQFRLTQARETIREVAGEINSGVSAKGDAYVAVTILFSIERNISDVMQIANPPQPTTTDSDPS